MTIIRLISNVFIRVAALILFVMGLNYAFTLANIDNNMAVAGAVFIFAGDFTAGYLFIRYQWPSLYNWLVQKTTQILLCLVVCGIAMTTTGCYKIIEPGHAGILVEQTGTARGVSDIPIKTGRVFYNPWNEYVLDYPTNVQRAIWTRSETEGKTSANEEIAFQSSDQLHFTGDVAVAYQLVHDRVPAFYVQFRNDDIEAFTHGFFRDAVRKSIGAAAQHYSQEQINGGNQADLEAEAQKTLTTAMEPYGVRIIQLAFTAPPRPPDAVKGAIEQKIAATQRAEQIENEKRQAIAEGQKTIALADAQAQANTKINASITPALIQWQQTKILGDKWDGHFSMVQGGGGNGLMLSLPVGRPQ